MSISRPFILVLAAAGHLATPTFAEPLSVGQPLPEEAAQLSLTTPDGRSASLGELKGPEGLLVVFTANTCAYSVDWRDRIPKLAEKTGGLEIGMALVNSNARKRKTDDSAEAMAAKAKEHFPDVEYWIDKGSKLADALGARRTPEVFLFDRELKLVYHGVIDDVSGPFEQVRQHFTLDALDALTSSGAMPEATAPLGCAILRPRKRRPKPPVKKTPEPTAEQGGSELPWVGRPLGEM